MPLQLAAAFFVLGASVLTAQALNLPAMVCNPPGTAGGDACVIAIAPLTTGTGVSVERVYRGPGVVFARRADGALEARSTVESVYSPIEIHTSLDSYGYRGSGYCFTTSTAPESVYFDGQKVLTGWEWKPVATECNGGGLLVTPERLESRTAILVVRKGMYLRLK